MSTPNDPEKYAEWRRKISESLKGHPAHNKGKPQSEEQKAKLSAVRKGRVPWNKGQKGRPLTEEEKAQKRAYRHSEETKARMRGRKISEEERAARSERFKGREVSEETRAKISASEKGKQVSEETRAKLSKAFMGKPSPTKGSKRDEAFGAKMSESNRKRWANATEEERRAHLDKLHRTIIFSRLEKAVAAKLDEQGVVYERQKRIGWYKVDFYVPAENRIIEANGCYWHQCEPCGYNHDFAEKKRAEDAKRYDYLRSKGYIVEIIWEHDLPGNRNSK